MFSENTLALLSLIAVSIAGGAGGGAFAAGVGKLLGIVSFGAIPAAYGTALGFGAFVVIVLTVVQLVFRLMRVTLSEWLGDAWVGFKNPHIAAIVSMVLTLGLVMSGTWIYLWQLFGASNQLMAALSLLIVTLWLKSSGRNPSYALYPMIFMYVTTMAGTLVTAYNLYASILSNPHVAGQPINVLGAVAMIIVAILLFAAALLIAYDAWGAWQKLRGRPLRPAPAPGRGEPGGAGAGGQRSPSSARATPRVDQARGCRASSSKRGAARSSARTISRSRRPRARNNHHRRGRSRGSSSTKTSADLRGGSACCTFSSTPDDPSQRSVVRSPSSVIPGWNQRSNRLPRRMLRSVPRANQPTTISAVRTNAARPPPRSIVLDCSHDAATGDDPRLSVRADRPGVRAPGVGNAGVAGNDLLRDHAGRHARAADHSAGVLAPRAAVRRAAHRHVEAAGAARARILGRRRIPPPRRLTQGGEGSATMTEQEKRGWFTRLKEILYGMGAHDMSRYALRTRASMEHLF